MGGRMLAGASRVSLYYSQTHVQLLVGYKVL